MERKDVKTYEEAMRWLQENYYTNIDIIAKREGFGTTKAYIEYMLPQYESWLAAQPEAEPFTEEQARAAAPAYSGVHARMFPFPLVIARLANFRDIYERRHAWFKRLHDLLHPLI